MPLLSWREEKAFATSAARNYGRFQLLIRLLLQHTTATSLIAAYHGERRLEFVFALRLLDKGLLGLNLDPIVQKEAAIRARANPGSLRHRNFVKRQN